MSFYCPQCNALIYSRKSGKCANCGAPLPPEMRLSAAEIAAEEREDAESQNWEKNSADDAKQQRTKIAAFLMAVVILAYATYMLYTGISGLISGHIPVFRRNSHKIISKQTEPVLYWQNEAAYFVFGGGSIAIGVVCVRRVFKSWDGGA